MIEGGHASSRRLPFTFSTQGAVGRLSLADLAVAGIEIDRLELEISDIGTDPGARGTREFPRAQSGGIDPSPPADVTTMSAERFQRRRTRLASLSVRATAAAVDERVAAVRRHLASHGISQVSAKLHDGFVSVRARATDGLAASDLSFRIQIVASGTHLRVLASTVRVHGHLPTPGQVIADRILVALLGATDASGVVERPHVRGLCDVEIDLVGALLWHLMPPSGWRLPATNDVELVEVKLGRGAIEIGFAPAGSRAGDNEPSFGWRHRQPLALAAAHDLMHTVDEQLRDGHYEEAMRGYRVLLAAGGPDQPALLERILALAAARPPWFFDGLELARQALGRWPQFPSAHAALASITLAQGDAREAANHLAQVAQLASAEGDDDQAALAALAGARLLRVLEPKAATELYALALEHDPASTEAADSLADRLADEHRWAELVRLARARAVTADVQRAVQLRLRLADVFVRQLGDIASAEQELAIARTLAPDDPAVHEMTATILATSNPAAAADAWRDVARLAEARGDQSTAARAYAILGNLVGEDAAFETWKRALGLDPMQPDALVGLATLAASRDDHVAAAELFERLREVGLPPQTQARHELALARSLVELDRKDDARASLRRAALAGGEVAAEAHAVLAEVAEAAADREHAAVELETAITSLVELATANADDRLHGRAAELAAARAALFDRAGNADIATAGWERAHELATAAAPEVARVAARTLLARTGTDARSARRWIDAVLATKPHPPERAALLVERAGIRRKEHTPDLAAALADLREALAITEGSGDAAVIATRRQAYALEAELLAVTGEQRARARALGALARATDDVVARVEAETAAAVAWLAADEPAAALPHVARAHQTITSADTGDTIPPPLRREVLVTLGEAAWRQRAWPDVIRAYLGLIAPPSAADRGAPDDAPPGPEPEHPRSPTFRYRLAVAAERTNDGELAMASLSPLVADARSGAPPSLGIAPEIRGQALRLYADLAERSGDLAAAAAALEAFAALGTETSTSARADAMYRAGELFRRAESAGAREASGARSDDAIRCLEAALRISDAHLPALDALEMAWRERGDLERVAVILGRKVAATARHANRQKPLLSRLGDLQDQLGRPDVALATHQRALEIEPTWRPSLRYVTMRLHDAGSATMAAAGLAQLAGELPGDAGVDLAVLARDRQAAAQALSELVVTLDAEQLRAVTAVSRPALERAGMDGVPVAAGLAALRGEPTPVPAPTLVPTSEESTQSGRVGEPRSGSITGNALSLRDAAKRERASGKLADALATLETANHVTPGNVEVLRDIIDIAGELGDHESAARHAQSLAELVTGPRRAEVLAELADIYYDQLGDAVRARDAMRRAADAFGGTRRDTTLRMLAAEAGSHLAWDVAVEALSAIPTDRRSAPDVVQLATALMRAGRDADALVAIERATAAGKIDDGGEMLAKVKLEVQRKAKLVDTIERQAEVSLPAEAVLLRAEALQLRHAIGLTDRKTRDWDLSQAVGLDGQPIEDDDDAVAEWVDEDDVVDESDLAIPADPPAAPVLARIVPRKKPSGPPPIDITATPRDDRDDRLGAIHRDDRSGPIASRDERNAPVISRTFTRANTEPPPDVSLDENETFVRRTHADSDAPPLSTARTPTPRRGSGPVPLPTRTSSQEIPRITTRAPTEPGIVAPRTRTGSTIPPAPSADHLPEEPDTIVADLEVPVATASPAVDAAEPAATTRPATEPPATPRTTTPPMGMPTSRTTTPPAGTPTSRTTTPPAGTPTSRTTTPPAGTPTSRTTTPPAGTPTSRTTTPPAGTPTSRTTTPPTGTRTTPPPPPAKRAPTEPPAQRATAEVPTQPPAQRATAEAPTQPPSQRATAEAPTQPPSQRATAEAPTQPPAQRATAEAPTEPHPPTEARPLTEARQPIPPRATFPMPTRSRAPAIVVVDEPAPMPSVVIAGTRQETANAIASAAAAASRDRLLEAYRAHPEDPAILQALLAHLGDREPTLRRNLLEATSRTTRGRTQAIALYELAQIARVQTKDPIRAQSLLTKAYEADQSFAAVWMPLADALVAGDDMAGARDLYDRVAKSDDYDGERRAFAVERLESLSKDDSIVSGEIGLVPGAEPDPLARAKQLAAEDDLIGAIAAAESAATAAPAGDIRALELLESLHVAAGDVTSASEAIGRQLVVVIDDATKRAQLWRRRAKLYRDALGREAEAYRCLKEAHAAAPADPEVAYQLRAAAIVRGEWALAASLLYREIAAATTPRDRGALHLELAMIYEQRLDDAPQAQVNYEQALAFDPSIPAVKTPLARRYEAIGRFAEAARLYEEAATNARAADRASLLEAAAHCRATSSAREPALAVQLDRAEAAGDLDAALDLAHQLWRAEPGHASAFRVLANVHRTGGDLAALTELTTIRSSRAAGAEERATAWLEVARLAEEVGALDQAARAYDLALIEDPGHTAALDARGALAFRLGDYRTADLIYRDLGLGDSVLGDDELALRRSTIAEHLGRLSESLTHAQAAVEAAPGRRDLLVRVQELATRLGEIPVALAAARGVLELVPLDDDDAQLHAQFALVALLREVGDLDAAVAQLERIIRDHPQHEKALESLTDLHIARGDWPTATRYLFQLVPLAPSTAARAERLYRLGEAVLVHLGDIDRADDVFLRASDLDPSHVPTLRRLLDVYWRADDPGALVEVAGELALVGALANGPVASSSLAQALVAAALVGDTQLAASLNAALGEDAPERVAQALAALVDREGRLQLASAGTAIAELARRGMLDLAKVRAAAVGTPVASYLSTT